MSATSPRPCRWSGPTRRRTEAPNRDPTLADVVAALQGASRSDGPTVLARLLDQAGISARYAIIKLVTGGLRIGVSARLAKQALADVGKVDVAEIEEVWHGLEPPYLVALRLAGRQRRAAEEGGHRPVPARHAVHPGRGQRPRKARPGGLRGRVEMGRHPRPGGRRGRPPPALFAHRRRDFRRLSRPDRRHGVRGRARRRASGRAPAGMDRHVFRPAAAAEPQERLAEDAREISGLRALLRPAAGRGRRSARPALHRAPAAAGGLRRASSTRRASTCRRSRPFADWAALEAHAPRAAASGHRGRHAEAARFGLCRRAPERAVVQVEARSAHGRRGADVCAARPRQAVELLFRLHVRRLVGTAGSARNWCPSARPISASPTRS